MFEELKKAVRQIWQGGLLLCDTAPTLFASLFLILGASYCVLFLLYMLLLVLMVADSTSPIDPRVVVPELPALFCIGVGCLGIGVAIIRRKLSLDPNYWKSKK